MTIDLPRRRRCRALPAASALLSALLGVGTAFAQHVEAGKAPPAWIAYAQIVSTNVQARLDSDDPLALRLRAYLQQLPGAAQADGATLKIAFWIDPAGKISRIDYPLFAQAQPNDDLQALLVGQNLPPAPPQGMLLPLRLSLHIKPKPADGATVKPAPAAMTISLRYRWPSKSGLWS